MNGEEAVFNLQTTIMIEMAIKNDKQGVVDMTGFLQQKVAFFVYRKQKRKSSIKKNYRKVWWLLEKWYKIYRQQCVKISMQFISAKQRRLYFQLVMNTQWHTNTRDVLWLKD